MNYTELKKKEEDRISSVPIVWAFSDAQLKEGAESKGLEVTELRAIGAGGYMRPQDKHLLDEAFEQNEKEREEWLKDPKNLEEAFRYELSNHEYCFTYDDVKAWVAVGLSMKNSTPEQRQVFVTARDSYLSSVVW